MYFYRAINGHHDGLYATPDCFAFTTSVSKSVSCHDRYHDQLQHVPFYEPILAQL